MIFEFNGIKPVIDPSSFIHPQANITGNVVIGKNVYVGPGTAIRGDFGKVIIKDGANVPIISVGYDNRSRLQNAESMNMITTNIIHQMYNDKSRAKAESFYTKMNIKCK